MKVALTGPVQLELIAPYFAKAGYGVAAPGEVPDVTYDVTSREKILAEETPGFYDPRLEKLAAAGVFKTNMVGRTGAAFVDITRSRCPQPAFVSQLSSRFTFENETSILRGA